MFCIKWLYIFNIEFMQAFWDVEEAQARAMQHLSSFVGDESGKVLLYSFICSALSLPFEIMGRGKKSPNNEKKIAVFLFLIFETYWNRLLVYMIVLVLVCKCFCWTAACFTGQEKWVLGKTWWCWQPRGMGKLTFVEEGNSYLHGDKLWVMPRAVRQSKS